MIFFDILRLCIEISDVSSDGEDLCITITRKIWGTLTAKETQRDLYCAESTVRPHYRHHLTFEWVSSGTFLLKWGAAGSKTPRLPTKS